MNKFYRRGFKSGRLNFLNGGETTMEREYQKRPKPESEQAEWRRGFERGRRNAMDKTRHILETP